VPSLYLFRRDLRLSDHAGLAHASAAGPVVPAFIIDAREESRLKASARRAAFACGALSALAAEVAARNGRLIVRTGPRISTVLRLARDAGAEAVFWSASYDAAGIEAERALQASLEERGIQAGIVHDAPAVDPEETTVAMSGSAAGYRSLAPYLSAWLNAPKPLALFRGTFGGAALNGDAPPAPERFGSSEPSSPHANEAGALAALDRFLSGRVLSYRSARNLPGQPTSGLSAHLSFGTLAARTVVQRVAARRSDPFLLAEERYSLAEFERSIARRDFFLQLGWFFAGSGDVPLQARMRSFKFSRTHPALDAWRAGTTGFPLVDAGMRELRATGNMHPRARSIVASFLCFDLGVDWRVGRDEWDRLLIEDDPALANGNWQWVAGVGADVLTVPRIFNPLKQARRLDPEANYVRRWIPELAGAPPAEILDPGARLRRTQLSLPLFDGSAYPAPAVEHDVVARKALARYADFVRAQATRARRSPVWEPTV
jgi:deoxyribodipyrimidine photo-lyase